MLKLGVIGTNWISNQFVEAALQTDKYKLNGVYSRTEEKARAFGEPYEAVIFETDLDTFAEHPEIDVVYVASPNSLHFQQTLTLLKAGKHVIVEKPIFSTPDEWEKAAKTAEENQVFLFEAARHIHEENFAIVKDQVRQIDDLEGASFTYMKYSSRYDAVLAGEEPNIFSLKFSGGALADLGVYPIYSALSWFGMPESSHYFCKKVQTGVDGKGTILLHYKNFDVTILTGKIANSYLPSEIYGRDKTISLDGVNSIGSIEIIDRKTDLKENIAQKIAQNPMQEEAEAFAEVISNPTDPDQQKNYQEWLLISKQVNQVLTDLRRDAGIVFSADQ